MPTLPTTYKPQQAKRLMLNRKRREGKRRCMATYSSRWRKIRLAHLAREPLCRECIKEGKITPGTDVDHIDGDSWNNDPDNYQTLCKSHHGKKTAKETGFQQSKRNEKMESF